MPDEHRLDELREQARNKGVVAGRGVDIAGGPIPRKLATASPSGGRAGYYGERVVRPPVWTWEIPVYFFVAELAGMAAVIALIGLELHVHHIFTGGFDQFLQVAASLLIQRRAFWGMFVATYTGVLLVATAIPAWFLHRTLLPFHFGVAGLGSAAALLELLGLRIAPLGALGFLAAGTETALWIWLEIDKHGKADRALRESGSGLQIRCGEILSGPLALILRV